MYQLNKDGSVTRLSDNAVIPNDQRNIDWIEYEAWIGLGNKPINLD